MASSQKDYYARLIKISQVLSKDDLKNLIFACGDVLPPAAADKVTAGTDLFHELKQRGRLGPSNYGYLREQLMVVGRDDLASTLPDQVDVFDEENDGSKTYFCCVGNPEDHIIPANLQLHPAGRDATYSYRMLLMYLSEQITNEEAQKLAFVMCPELCDESVTPFGFIRYLSRNRDITSASFVDILSSSLNVIGRIDLAQFVNSMEATQALSPSLSNNLTSAI